MAVPLRWRTTTPQGEIVVEEARRDDAPDLLTLHLNVLAEGRWFITEPHEFHGSVEHKARQVLELQRAPNSVFLVARRGPRLVGFLTLQGGALRRMRHTGKLEIMVHPSARGLGVGRALMAACIEWATENPLLTKIGLNVFSDNLRAIRLYEHFGFEREGHRVREYRMADGSWRDDILMYRFVDTP